MTDRGVGSSPDAAGGPVRHIPVLLAEFCRALRPVPAISSAMALLGQAATAAPFSPFPARASSLSTVTRTPLPRARRSWQQAKAG